MTEIYSVCRLCLNNGEPLLPIFTEYKPNTNGLSLPDKIMCLAKVQVLENDGLPRNICVKCYYQVTVYIEFKQTCEKSYVILTKKLCKNGKKLAGKSFLFDSTAASLPGQQSIEDNNESDATDNADPATDQSENSFCNKEINKHNNMEFCFVDADVTVSEEHDSRAEHLECTNTDEVETIVGDCPLQLAITNTVGNINSWTDEEETMNNETDTWADENTMQSNMEIIQNKDCEGAEINPEESNNSETNIDVSPDLPTDIPIDFDLSLVKPEPEWELNTEVDLSETELVQENSEDAEEEEVTSGVLAGSTPNVSSNLKRKSVYARKQHPAFELDTPEETWVASIESFFAMLPLNFKTSAKRNGAPLYQCMKCESYYPTKAKCISHMKSLMTKHTEAYRQALKKSPEKDHRKHIICHTCGFVCTTRSESTIHQVREHRSCPVCKVCFPNIQDKMKHVCSGKPSVDTRTSDYCTICNCAVKRWNSHLTSVKHMKNVMSSKEREESTVNTTADEEQPNGSVDKGKDDSVDKVKCDYCDIVLLNQRGLLIHMRRSHNTLQAVYSCNLCSHESFSSRESCTLHVNKVHNRTRGDNVRVDYVEEEPKTVKLEDDCRKVIKMRKLVNKYSCSYCGKSTDTFEDCLNHLRRSHKTNNASKVLIESKVETKLVSEEEVQEGKRKESKQQVERQEKVKVKQKTSPGGSLIRLKKTKVSVKKQTSTGGSLVKLRKTGVGVKIRLKNVIKAGKVPKALSSNVKKRNLPHSNFYHQSDPYKNFSAVEQDDGTQGFKCNCCNVVFKEKRFAYRHYYRHVSKKFAKFVCRQCNLQCVSRSQLMTHKIKVHKNYMKRGEYHLKKYIGNNLQDKPVVPEDKPSAVVDAGPKAPTAVFYCRSCNSRFQSRSELMVHRMKAHRQDIHVMKKQHKEVVVATSSRHCDVCDVNVINMTQHVRSKTHHSKKLSLQDETNVSTYSGVSMDSKESTDSGIRFVKIMFCKKCHKTFKNESELKEHEDQHTSDIEEGSQPESKPEGKETDKTEQKNDCRHCGQHFKSKIWFDNHINSEVCKGPYLYNCQSCSKRFNSKFHLLKHDLIMHKDRAHFSCQYCSKLFVSIPKAKQHEKKCPRREKALYKRSLAAEENTSVKKELVHICTACDHQFTSTKAFRSHVKDTHTDYGVYYRCLECREIDEHRSSAILHIKQIHNGTAKKELVCIKRSEATRHSSYQCEFCNFKASVVEDLEEHILTHPISEMEHNRVAMDNEEDRADTQSECFCKLCEMTFISDVALIEHLSTSMHINNRNLKLTKKVKLT